MDADLSCTSIEISITDTTRYKRKTTIVDLIGTFQIWGAHSNASANMCADFDRWLNGDPTAYPTAYPSDYPNGHIQRPIQVAISWMAIQMAIRMAIRMAIQLATANRVLCNFYFKQKQINSPSTRVKNKRETFAIFLFAMSLAWSSRVSPSSEWPRRSLSHLNFPLRSRFASRMCLLNKPPECAFWMSLQNVSPKVCSTIQKRRRSESGSFVLTGQMVNSEWWTPWKPETRCSQKRAGVTPTNVRECVCKRHISVAYVIRLTREQSR